MKSSLKSNFSFIFFTLLLLVCNAIISLEPEITDLLIYGFSLISILPFLTIFFNNSKVRFNKDNEKPDSLPKWVGRAVFALLINALFFLTNMIVYWGFFTTEFGLSSVLSSAEFLEVITEFNISTFWLFPFGMYFLFAITLLYGIHIKGYPSSIAHYIAENCPTRVFSRMRDYGYYILSISTIYIIGLTVAAIVLLSCMYIDYVYRLPIYKYPHLSIFALFILLIFSNLKYREILTLGNRFGVKLNAYLIVYIIFTLIMICILADIGQDMLAAHVKKSEDLRQEVISFMENLLPADYVARLFYFGYGLITMPLMGTYLARISIGRSIREIALLGLSIVLVVKCSFEFLNYYNLSLATVVSPYLTNSPITWVFLAIFNLLVLIVTCYNVNGTSLIITAWYKPEGKLRTRGLIKVLPPVMAFCINFTIIGLKTAWLFTSFFFAMQAFFVACIIPFAFYFFVRDFYSD